MSAAMVDDCIDFADFVRGLSDAALLHEHDRLALERVRTVLGNSYSDEKSAQTNLFTAYEEIQHRIKRNNWCPKKPRQKRTWN